MVNKVVLVGHVGKDAELRFTPSGDPVCTFSLATSEIWNGKDGKRNEKTEWHRIVLWGKSAQSLAEYLLKGKQIYVDGRLQTRKWTGKDGTQRYTTEVRAHQIVLLSGRERSGPAPRDQHVRDEDVASGAGPVMPSDEEITRDDIPF